MPRTRRAANRGYIVGWTTQPRLFGPCKVDKITVWWYARLMCHDFFPTAPLEWHGLFQPCFIDDWMKYALYIQRLFQMNIARGSVHVPVLDGVSKYDAE
jgi:hypothetical protein